MAIARISMSLSPGFPKTFIIFPSGALRGSFHKTISAKTFCPVLALFKNFSGIKMSVYIFVSSGFRKNPSPPAPLLSGEGGRRSGEVSSTPVKRIFAREIIFVTSPVCRPCFLGCRIISTVSPCRAEFRSLKSISMSFPTPAGIPTLVGSFSRTFTYPVPLAETEIVPCCLFKLICSCFFLCFFWCFIPFNITQKSRLDFLRGGGGENFPLKENFLKKLKNKEKKRGFFFL